MGKRLSSDELARYQRDGCLHPIRIMSGEEMAEHRRRLESAEAEHGTMHYRTKPYLLLTSAAELGRSPILLDAVDDILGPNILTWDSAYVTKEARDTRFVAWHQDLTYWGLDSSEVVTAWVALSHSNVDNGCMRFIPGTHENGRVAHEDTYDAKNILHRGQQINGGFDEADAVDIVLEPGEVSLHHGWVIHASNANTSDARRIGLTIQYAATSVRQTHTDQESATLVRGVDNYRHFNPEPVIDSDFSAEGVAFQERAQRVKHEVYDNA